MNKIYAISHGSYSDYGVDFLFLDEPLRDRVLARLTRIRSGGLNDFYAQEFTLVEDENEVPSVDYYYVTVDRDGNEVDRIGWTMTRNAEEVDQDVVEDYSKDDKYHSKYYPNYYVRGFSTKSFDHALKAARDRAAQRRAGEEGIA